MGGGYKAKFASLLPTGRQARNAAVARRYAENHGGNGEYKTEGFTALIEAAFCIGGMQMLASFTEYSCWTVFFRKDGLRITAWMGFDACR